MDTENRQRCPCKSGFQRKKDYYSYLEHAIEPI